MPLFTAFIIPNGESLYVVDSNGVIGPVLSVDQFGNVAFMAHPGTNTLLFYDKDSFGLFSAQGNTKAMAFGPDVKIRMLDASFNEGNVLLVDGSGNTVLQSHPTGNKVDLADSSGNVSLTTKQSSTTPDPGNNGTISTTGIGLARVTPAANRTGVILQAGTAPAQKVTVVNNSTSFSITFAAVGTSNVADGTSAVIAANRCMMFQWDSVAAKWYH